MGKCTDEEPVHLEQARLGGVHEQLDRVRFGQVDSTAVLDRVDAKEIVVVGSPEGGSGNGLLGQDRPKLRRQGEIAEAHRAHDVVNDASVAGLQSFRDVVHVGFAHAAGRQAGPIGSNDL